MNKALITCSLIVVSLIVSGILTAFTPPVDSRAISTATVVPAEDALYPFLYEFGQHYASGAHELAAPSDVAVDSSNNRYIVDTELACVKVFNPAGNVLYSWGSAGSGNGQFNNPGGIALDSSDNVYVADTSNDRVQVFDSSGNYLRQWGSSGSGDGLFDGPNGISIDNNDLVYVADTGNNRIQVFSTAGVFVRKWGSVGTADGQFLYVFDVCTDNSGNVYAIDMILGSVSRFLNDGTFVTSWGSAGTGAGEFSSPFGIAWSSSGVIYVADTGNHRVQAFDTGGTYQSEWGTEGTGDSQFNNPVGVHVGTAGKIIVTDNEIPVVQEFTSAGVFSLKYGTSVLDDGDLSMPRFSGHAGSDYLYVVDRYLNYVNKFSTTGTFLSRWSVSGAPTDAAVDKDGNVYVTDSIYDRVQKFDSNGNYLLEWTTPNSYPIGIIVDNQNRVVVVCKDLQRTYVYDTSGNEIGTMYCGDAAYPFDVTQDGDGNYYVTNDRVLGGIAKFDSSFNLLDYWETYDDGTGSRNFYTPEGIAFDHNGNLLVVLANDNSVLVLDTDGNYITSIGTGSEGTGEGEFWYPVDVTVDGENRIFVNDSYNRRIQVFSGGGDTGGVRVFIKPDRAVAAGAQWRLKHQAGWREAGTTAHGVKPGTYTVVFNKVDGFTKAPDTQITVYEDMRTEVTGTYVRKQKPTEGYLRIRLKPSKARRLDARWRIKGTSDWHESGEKIAMEAGVVKIEFTNIKGLKKPSVQTVTVETGKTFKCAVTYTKK